MNKEDLEREVRARLGMPPEGMRKELVRAKQNKEVKEELRRLRNGIDAFCEERTPRDNPSDVILARILLEDYEDMRIERQYVRLMYGTWFAVGFFVGGIVCLSAGWMLHFLR